MTLERPPELPLRRLILAGAVLSLAAAIPGPALAAPLKVSCVGEHTTHSDLYSNNREQQPVGMQEYPMVLQPLLGSGYDVRNHGDCCASVVQGYPSSETHPYVNGSNYKNSINFTPDIVVIGSWGRHDWGLSRQTAAQVFSFPKFQTDYEDLVKRYVNLPNHPKIYCSTPIPILFGEDGPDNGFKTSPAADAVKMVAAKYNLPIIDLFNGFLGHKEYFRSGKDKDPEGEHLNDAGIKKLAEMVAAALKSETAVPDGGTAPGGDAGAGGSVGRPAVDGGSVGGSIGTGGSSGSGGAGPGATGGESVSGGATGSGGYPVSGSGGNGSGGAVGSGGQGTGGSGPGGLEAGGGSSGGCAVSSGRHSDAASLSLIGAVLFALAVRGRRRSQRP